MNVISNRIARNKAGLVVVDIQERLLPAIHERERVVANAARLVKGAAIMRLPIFVTEHYRKGIGPTAPEVAAAVPDFAPIEKITFNSCDTEGFVDALEAKGVRDIVLCGIEAHVCVTQTCLGLLAQGFNVYVATDAISSRTPENHQIAVGRMRDAGAVIASTEMMLFELLGCGGTDEFKQILSLVR